MRQTGTNKGFTLGETLIVVGILAVLLSVGSLAVWSYMRSLHQLEMDGIAKEIFVAAQNHLTMADSQGLLAGKAPDGQEEINPDTDKGTGVYYYVVGADGTYPTDNGASALDLMLPTASVDETVRLGGSYVIRYDHAHARVLDVFFDWKTGRYSHTFTVGEYSSVISNYKDTKDDTGNPISKSSKRREDGIGWYGGDSVESLTVGETIKEPTIRVINAERLWVEINNPNANSTDPLNPTIPSEYSGLQLSLIVKGETSGKSRVIQLLMDTGLPYDTVVSCPNKKANNCAVFTVLLDDVTKPKDENSNGNHFSNLFQTDGLIPGENITVQAVAFNNTKLTNVAYSSEVKTNSLFGALKTSDENDNTVSASNAKAIISNIRHLENLSNTISSIDTSSSYWIGTGENKITITKAEQTADLDWNQFVADLKEADAGIAAYNAGGVQIYTKDKATEPTDCYYPVNLADSITYNGGKHGIQNLNVNHTGPAGVFGSLDNCVLNEVYVYNTVTDDKALEVRGTGVTGGLVGEMNAGTITGCAAAVYVTSMTDSAGGLVGKASAADIEKSYSGGHTVSGAYLANPDDAVAGRFNVRAAKNAGGLVGEISGTKVLGCYSTCSAYCTDTQDTDTEHYGIGGLVGSAAGGEIKNCYSTGLVGLAQDDDIMGAFAGIFDTVDTVTLGSADLKNHCYSITNPDVSRIGSNETDAQVGFMDESMETYATFFPATTSRTSKPYDPILKAHYQKKDSDENYYPFKNVTDISVHYGDWPAAETLIINHK